MGPPRKSYVAMTLDSPSIGGTKRAVPVFLARCGRIVFRTPRPAGGLPQIDLCTGARSAAQDSGECRTEKS